jgi:hypothetical protein
VNIKKFRQQLNRLVKEYDASVKNDNRRDNRLFLAEMELLDWAQIIQSARLSEETHNV